MGKKIVEIGITEQYFEGVPRQGLAAHNAISELVDNALSNPQKGSPSLTLVSIDKAPEGRYRITVADWGRGMNETELENALQFGSKHTDEGYLCIYGVGLCNSLLSLSQHKYKWTVASKKPKDKGYNVIVGPFKKKMELDTEVKIQPFQDVVMRKETEMYGAPSTIVSVETDKRVISTMLSSKGNCAPSKVSSINILRRAMVEHLGVKYRGFLEADKKTGKVSARILMTNFVHKDGKKEDVFIRPLYQPYAERHVFETKVIIDGYDVPVTVEYGLLDKQQTNNLVMGEYETSYHYKHNPDTQGFDIQLGQRTVAVAQMESIWGLKPHSTLNAWTGCVKVDVMKAKMPRGFLNTLSNKSDIDNSDPGWQKIFDVIRQRPEMRPFAIPGATLELYREGQKSALQTVFPDHKVEIQYAVYSSRMRADIINKAPNNTCTVYYIAKKKEASIEDLTRLRTCWDGMLHEGIQPMTGFLICKKCGPMLKQVIEEWNRMYQMTESVCNSTPRYNFEVKIDPNLPD